MRGSGMAVQEDVRGPLVFQCRECRTIIGDSFSMVSAVESLDAIILSGSRSSRLVHVHSALSRRPMHDRKKDVGWAWKVSPLSEAAQFCDTIVLACIKRSNASAAT
eukprot:766482-Hanusia_phi.AAC.8